MALTTHSLPIQSRQGGKPNSTTRNRIRWSLGDTCWTCGLESSWSQYAPQYARLEIGHVVAREVGGTYHWSNVIGQCWTCNRAADAAGVTDLTDALLMVPTAWMPQRLADARGKANEAVAPVGLASEQDRHNAREALGLVW